MKPVAAATVASFVFALTGCAHAPMPQPSPLLHDELFAQSSATIDPSQALASSDAMKAYAARIARSSKLEDRRQQLLDALYREGDLKLEYDSATTRTAAQAFDAREGNCLALVLMTGALARELGLNVQYNYVVGAEAWDRQDDMFISVAHVNLALNTHPIEIGAGLIFREPLIVDFIPPRDRSTQRRRRISEETVVAMFLNNRAVEALVDKRLDDAYAWAREAVLYDPSLTSAWLTLSVIYRDRHHPAEAEAVLADVLAREPDNLPALSNRLVVLRDERRMVEAESLERQIKSMDPHPPYSYFDAGMTALHAARYDDARDLFRRELDRAPYHPEFEYWLAVSYDALGDEQQAQAHLARAAEVSSSRTDRDLYATKLARFRALVQ